MEKADEFNSKAEIIEKELSLKGSAKFILKKIKEKERCYTLSYQSVL